MAVDMRIIKKYLRQLTSTSNFYYLTEYNEHKCCADNKSTFNQINVTEGNMYFQILMYAIHIQIHQVRVNVYENCQKLIHYTIKTHREQQHTMR